MNANNKIVSDKFPHLIAVDWESEGVAGQDIDYRVVERRWSSVQEEDEYGRTLIRNRESLPGCTHDWLDMPGVRGPERTTFTVELPVAVS